jgi:alpha 1,3-glucosidase
VNEHFGEGFMQNQYWLKNFSNNLKTEEQLKYKRESFMLSFFFNSSYLYGLPERSERIVLGETGNTDPYRLIAVDVFPHTEFDMGSLYSGIPYVTGHSREHDESVLWISAAESWVDIIEKENE